MAIRDFMAKAERGAQTAAQSETPRPMPPAAPATRTVAPSTSVDATSEVEGRLRCCETLRIDGRVKGSVECEKMVLVGEGARVQASISAHEVRISGIVEGDIAAQRKITLERTAVVTGDLTTPGIVIEEGAKLKGRIVIGSDEAAPEVAKPKNAKKAAGPRKAHDAAAKPDEAPSPQAASAPATAPATG